jgi:hypothetical protein
VEKCEGAVEPATLANDDIRRQWDWKPIVFKMVGRAHVAIVEGGTI